MGFSQPGLVRGYEAWVKGYRERGCSTRAGVGLEKVLKGGMFERSSSPWPSPPAVGREGESVAGCAGVWRLQSAPSLWVGGCCGDCIVTVGHFVLVVVLVLLLQVEGSCRV